MKLTEVVVKELVGVDVIGREVWSKHVTSSSEHDHLVPDDCCCVKIPLWYPVSLLEWERMYGVL